MDKITILLADDHVLIRMDIAMPKLNGIQATKQIKARCPATAVLILTAYDDDQYVFALLDAGATSFLTPAYVGDALARVMYTGFPTITYRVELDHYAIYQVRLPPTLRTCLSLHRLERPLGAGGGRPPHRG